MADVSVRPARSDDAAEIARIQVQTWRTAYPTILPAAVLDALSVQAAQSVWADAITAPPTARHHVLVAMEQQWTVGFAALGPVDPATPDEAAPGEPEADTTTISALLVEPRWGRRGHASRLLAAAVDHARGDGTIRALMWIPEADTVSREFLLGAGWAPDGLVRALDTGAGELREIRLHVSLAPVE
ncbi:MAG: GNAT family N-acetyltransferase [Jatrophihabitantaceae bacterium]